MKVAFVHDWLTGMRGGEKVLESMLSLYPDAEIFTLLHLPGRLSAGIESHPIHTSFIQNLPSVADNYRRYLPLFPRAIESFDFSGFDLVVSSSHCVAKGARAAGNAPHICYCHTPMRYIWDAYDAYFGPGRASLPVRAAMRSVLGYLRRWDVSTCPRVDHFIANSENVAGKIRRYYGRDADVLHPWVDHEFFTPDDEAGDDYFLIVTALVPYKRVEIAVEAFASVPHRLIVAGDGPERDRLIASAPDNVRFVGRVDDEELRDLYRGCRALLFPGLEDFGIVPLEAMACGRPVIALRAGGALETVREGVSGTFFETPDAAGLRDAVLSFEKHDFDPARIRGHAVGFDRDRFLERFRSIVDEVLSRKHTRTEAVGGRS